MEGDLGVNEQTFIVPLKKSQLLIFVIFCDNLAHSNIMYIIFSSVHVFSFFVPINILFLMALISYLFSFLLYIYVFNFL